jgi:hypothetical protein
MKFSSDIDIDFGDRTQVLKLINHVPAMQRKDTVPAPHNTGVYVTDIPADPVTGLCTIDYKTAEQRGYIKLDLLNVGVYSHIKNEQQLEQLMSTVPNWHRFNTDREFFEQLIHVNNHWDLLKHMPEPVDSIARLAMFLAVIRPAKRGLMGNTWIEVARTVWDRTEDVYYFKKAHAVSYAHLVVVNMNLIESGQLAHQSN